MTCKRDARSHQGVMPFGCMPYDQILVAPALVALSVNRLIAARWSATTVRSGTFIGSRSLSLVVRRQGLPLSSFSHSMKFGRTFSRQRA